MQNPRTHLVAAAQCAFVFEHQLPNREPLVGGHLQQFRRARKWIRQRRVCRSPAGLVFPISDNETPANRKISSRQKDISRWLEGCESHPVRMLRHRPRRNHLIVVEDQVIHLPKRNCPRPEQREPPRGSNLNQLWLNGRRIDRRSFLSAQPQQHRPIGPVPPPGKRQRSIQLCPNLGHAPQHALLLQFQNEAPRRPHRSHRVRTRRPNAHLEQIEQAGLHGYRVQVAGYRLQADERRARL